MNSVIFRRHKDAAEPEAFDGPDDDELDDELDDDEFDDDDDDSGERDDYDGDDGEDAPPRREPADEWEELDFAQDWRADGPFDIDEVDFDADDIARVDLGALIVTPEPDLKIQLVVDQKTKQADTLIVAAGDSALQVSVLAAPGTEGFVAEWRHHLLEETAQAGGEAQIAEGPFGTELRRVMPVTGPDGQQAQLKLRDWLVHGPRWLLHARLLGKAALDTADRGPAAELGEFFRNLIVRRGDVAQVPGTPVALHPPEQR
ncbi:MAG: DUF3710 domain-containing protein [Propionibacteriaceae bacterium]|nr:DUF3710 domain-containing protein [Propionibacteriaceae bacterium]